MSGSYASHLIELVTAALDCGGRGLPESSSTRAALRHRSQSYVRARLADRDLDPRQIAAAMGISVRYLHRLFEDGDVSLCEFLLRQRLEAALADLRNPAKADLPVAEIAERCGFRSHSSFARSFRTHYGMSATAFRSGAAG
jgi:AraC-like DNA-binding protein